MTCLRGGEELITEKLVSASPPTALFQPAAIAPNG